MHTNKYLFGTNDVPEFPADIIARRVELLNETLEILLDNSTYTRSKKEADQIAEILKAIRWHNNINLMGQSE